MANTPAQVALLPCPHCGEAEHIYPAYRVDTDGKCHSPYAIDCIGCGYDFTPREGMDVFAAWNRRASLSSEAGDDGQGALVERARYFVENPSAWESGFDQAASDRLAEILAAYEALTRENAALRADKKRLRTFAHEATKAITGLTAGGSEYFGGEVDGIYLADLPLCVERIRERFATPRQKAAERRLAEQGQAQGEAVENDPHRFAVVSSDYCRPFLLGAYPKLENAVKAQCGSPEKWDIFERYIATPQAGRRVMAEKPKITFERQYGGGYVVFADEDRLGFVRELSRGEWVSTDSYLNAVRGTRPTRKKAVEVLLRRHRKQGEA